MVKSPSLKTSALSIYQPVVRPLFGGRERAAGALEGVLREPLYFPSIGLRYYRYKHLHLLLNYLRNKSAVCSTHW